MQCCRKPSSGWRHWRCLASLRVRVATHPSASKIWGTGLAVVAPGLIPGARLESPMASAWFLVIGVPAPHQTGPPTRTLHATITTPMCTLCFLRWLLGIARRANHYRTLSLLRSSMQPLDPPEPPPGSVIAPSPAPSHPARSPGTSAFFGPPRPGLTDVSRGHVPLHLSNSLLACVVCCLSMVNGGPRAWLLLDGVTDRLTRRPFPRPDSR